VKLTLQELGLVDALPEPVYDNLTQLAAHLLKTPVSLISIVDFDNDCQFFKSQLGLSEPWATAQQTPLSHSFCQHVVRKDAPLVVDDAPNHSLVKDNLAISELGVGAYLGVPVYTPEMQPVGALCVIEEKARKWSDEEVASLKQLANCVTDAIRLNASLNTSEQLRQEQCDFTYAISHDLMSPANNLSMLLSELQEERLSTEGRYFLNLGLATTMRMKQQVQDILEYTQTIGDKDTFQTVNLNTLFDEIADDVNGGLKLYDISLERDTLPSVIGSRAQLRSLFKNLISNSIKFRASNRPAVIRVSSETDPLNRVEKITFEDNGIGIAAENHERIFRLFGRLHVREDYPGTGVGLALCRRVCLNHRGTLRVCSELGAGAVFTVSLPRKSP
tara:strand:+ start:217 stop:1383 length:1167 start_codon:yes stop_codon:yes gene_type:complete